MKHFTHEQQQHSVHTAVTCVEEWGGFHGFVV